MSSTCVSGFSGANTKGDAKFIVCQIKKTTGRFYRKNYWRGLIGQPEFAELQLVLWNSATLQPQILNFVVQLSPSEHYVRIFVGGVSDRMNTTNADILSLILTAQHGLDVLDYCSVCSEWYNVLKSNPDNKRLVKEYFIWKNTKTRFLLQWMEDGIVEYFDKDKVSAKDATYSRKSTLRDTIKDERELFLLEKSRKIYFIDNNDFDLRSALFLFRKHRVQFDQKISDEFEQYCVLSADCGDPKELSLYGDGGLGIYKFPRRPPAEIQGLFTPEKSSTKNEPMLLNRKERRLKQLLEEKREYNKMTSSASAASASASASDYWKEFNWVKFRDVSMEHFLVYCVRDNTKFRVGVGELKQVENSWDFLDTLAGNLRRRILELPTLHRKL